MDDQPPRGYGTPSGTPIAEEARPLHGFPDLRPETPPPGGAVLPARRSRLRRLLWLLLLAILIAAIIWWVIRHHEASNTSRFINTGAMPVGTATVAKGDMPVIDNALGTVTPLATVTVQTQINGQLTEVGFQEGQMVKQGDFLAQIDPRPYQVALEQAQGQLAKDQALLADAQLDLARYKKLVAQNAIASQTLDTQTATVAQDKGTVQTDQAQVDAQQLNLIYCHIIAPISGRVGLRQVDPGNYIQTSSSTGIVVITEQQPISVIFTLPEDSLQAVMKQVHNGLTLQATAFDRTGNTQLSVGQLSTIDNQIDPTTGTVKLRATFSNATLNLFPNQFVNIKLKVDTLQGTNIVPMSAIQRGAPGTFVYLVKSDNTVSAQPVTLGPDDGQNVAVTKGLQPGQVVVTDGADRLKDGAAITVTENGTQPNQPTGGQPGQPNGGGRTHGQGRGQGTGQAPSSGAPGAVPSGQSPAPAQPTAPAPGAAPSGQNPAPAQPTAPAPGGAPSGQSPAPAQPAAPASPSAPGQPGGSGGG